MKKWCIVDDFERLYVFESKEEALEEAHYKWNKTMSLSDRKKRDDYIVGLCNVEEVKPGEWSYCVRENGDVDADVYEAVKNLCEIDKIAVEEAKAEVLNYINSLSDEDKEDYLGDVAGHVNCDYRYKLTEAEIEKVWIDIENMFDI